MGATQWMGVADLIGCKGVTVASQGRRGGGATATVSGCLQEVGWEANICMWAVWQQLTDGSLH